MTALALSGAAAGQVSLTMEEQFFMVTRHPCTFNIKSGVDKDGRIIARHCDAVVERRRLCRYRPARDAEGGFHRRRPYDIDNVAIDSYARLHQPPARGRAARLRRAANLLGLRVPYRHDRRGARYRSDRFPAQEYAARRPAAGDRHDLRDAAIEACSTAWPSACIGIYPSIAAADGSGAAAASRSASRASPRRRPRSPSSISTATAAAAFTSARSIWARAPIRRWRRSPPRS